MNNRLERMGVEAVLGFSPPVDERDSASITRVPVDHDGLMKLVGHWSALSPTKIPALQGITISPGEESRILLNLLIDQGGAGPFLCVEADMPRDRVLPNFSSIWPYADWWQEELAVFFGVRFESKNAKEGVAWRRA